MLWLSDARNYISYCNNLKQRIMDSRFQYTRSIGSILAYVITYNPFDLRSQQMEFGFRLVFYSDFFRVMVSSWWSIYFPFVSYVWTVYCISSWELFSILKLLLGFRPTFELSYFDVFLNDLNLLGKEASF